MKGQKRNSKNQLMDKKKRKQRKIRILMEKRKHMPNERSLRPHVSFQIAKCTKRNKTEREKKKKTIIIF